VNERVFFFMQLRSFCEKKEEKDAVDPTKSKIPVEETERSKI
jgi:hypothetical protein